MKPEPLDLWQDDLQSAYLIRRPRIDWWTVVGAVSLIVATMLTTWIYYQLFVLVYG